MTMLQPPPRETDHEAGGYVKGVAVAIVIDNKDPEGLSRVKLRYQWHDKPTTSCWARLASPMAGKQRGYAMVPEVNDEVLVAFEREDLRFPYVLGSLWNGQDKSPLPVNNGKNDKRVICSRKKHHLLFDDGPTGVVELHHEKGRKVVLDDNGFVVQDEKGNVVKVDSNTGAMTIEAKGQLNIKATKITIEATTELHLKGGPMLKIEGGMVNIN
jgi:uncharacterized protein involved in type VI secretion and phage assembly